jgi:hypothetical protein
MLLEHIVKEFSGQSKRQPLKFGSRYDGLEVTQLIQLLSDITDVENK